MRNARWIAMLLAVMFAGCGNSGGLDTAQANVEVGATAPPSEAAGSEDSEAESSDSDNSAESEDVGVSDETPDDTAAAPAENLTTTEATSSSTPPSSEALVSTDREPDRSGERLIVSYDFSFDFDSTSWRAIDQYLKVSEIKWFTSGDTAFEVRTGVGTLVDGQPSRAACEDPQNRPIKRILRSDIEAGRSFCILTTEQGWAWIEFLDYDRGGGSLADFVATINVWYWKD